MIYLNVKFPVTYLNVQFPITYPSVCGRSRGSWLRRGSQRYNRPVAWTGPGSTWRWPGWSPALPVLLPSSRNRIQIVQCSHDYLLTLCANCYCHFVTRSKATQHKYAVSLYANSLLANISNKSNNAHVFLSIKTLRFFTRVPLY